MVFDFFSLTNTSIAGIFLGGVVSFLIPFLKHEKKLIKYITLFIFLALAVLLITSNSRAGWFGVAVAFLYVIYKLGYIKSKQVILAILFFLLIVFVSLLFYKPDSSLGRNQIYIISLEMLKDNWQQGIGLGKFKANFNEYQTSFFSSHSINSKRALLADNTFFAFNDYLQWVIETGVLGFLALVLMLYFIVKRIVWLQKEQSKKLLVLSATASLISIAVAALFSYPMQNRVIQGLVLICLAIISFYPVPMSGSSIFKSIVTITTKVVVIALSLLFTYSLIDDYKRKKYEKEASELAIIGYRKEAIKKYQKIIEMYPNIGVNYFYYTQELYYSNQLPDALKILKKGKFYYVDNRVYKLQADIEQELGMLNEAEKSYLHTIYMVPNRMGSRFDLLKFYTKTKDTSKAIYWANSILNMQIKVPSEKTERLLEQTQVILNTLKK